MVYLARAARDTHRVRFGACHPYDNKHPQDIEFARTTVLSMKAGNIWRRGRTYRHAGVLSKGFPSPAKLLSPVSRRLPQARPPL